MTFPLPVLAVASRSYGYVWDNRALLLPPLGVVFLIEFVVAVAAEQVGASTLSRYASILTISLAGMIGLMTFAVGLHRTILLREDRRGISFLRWDADLRRYVWAWFKILMLTMGCAMIVGIAFSIMLAADLPYSITMFFPMAIILLACAIILPRSVIALPAAAVGDDGSIRHAWQLTRGNWLRLIAVLILAILPFMVLGLLLELPKIMAAVMGKMVPSVSEAMQSLKYVIIAFGSALRAVSTAVLTVTLSLSYGAVTGKEPS